MHQVSSLKDLTGKSRWELVMLEKRRINKRMSGLYTATAVMTVVSFLYFLGQIKVFFADAITVH